jgi:UDP-2,3-diacylglucosamine hydrolase
MIYFISDVHLGLFERKKDQLREQQLLELLRVISKDCSALYLVGDIFDYWFEYKTVVPRHFYRTLAALKWMRESGIEIEYLMGNHDFGHLDFFEKELDIKIYPDDIERNLLGKKFYLSHGDGKSYKDTGYKILKKILRSPVSQWIYTKLHPNLGIGLASHSSKSSRGYTDSKDFNDAERDGMRDFAIKKIEEGFDYVIMGHRHKLHDEKISKGKYINLGDWISEPHCGRFDGKKFELVKVKELIGK